MGDLITEIINVPLDSSLILVLSVAYVIVASVRTYDVRLIQANKIGASRGVARRAEGRVLPTWINGIHWVGWALLVVLVVLNWKYAIALYAVLFILRVVPVLEMVGEIITRPFLKAE